MSYSSTSQSDKQMRPNKLDGVLSATPLLWRLGLTSIFYWFLTWGGNDLFEGLMRTLITCDAPVPKDGACPTGSFFSEGVCAPVGRSSPDWSGSLNCLDKNHVMDVTTRFGGRATSVKLVVCLVLSAFVGSVMIDRVGRKFVLQLSLVCLLIGNVLIIIACRVPQQAHLMIYLASCFSSLMVMVLSASWAMAADLVPKDATSRSVSYSFLHVIQHLGIVITFVAGFFVLRANLIDYTWVYVFLALFAFAGVTITALILPETVGIWKQREAVPLTSPEDSSESTGTMKNPVRELRDAFAIVCQDPFLRHNLAVCFMSTMACSGVIQISGSFAISTANLTLSMASLGGVFQPLCIAVAACGCSQAIDRIGPFWTHYIANFIIVAGYIVTGLGALFPNCAQAFYWTGWCLITGIGFGLSGPSYTAMQGTRLDSSHHGKLFAVQGVFGSQCFGAGAIAGSYIWSNIFYDGNITTGLLAARGFFVSAFLQIFTTFYSIFLWRKYILPEMQHELAQASCEALDQKDRDVL